MSTTVRQLESIFFFAVAIVCRMKALNVKTREQSWLMCEFALLSFSLFNVEKKAQERDEREIRDQSELERRGKDGIQWVDTL